MRKCGACQLCCVLPAIKELNKPANVPCQHLTEKGCGIYATRPDGCRKFECHWLGGVGDERPDVVGAYTARIHDGDGWGDGTGIMVHQDPNRFGRHVQLQRAIEDTVSTGGDVLMFAGDQRRLITRNPAQLKTAALIGLTTIDGRNVIVEKA